MRTVRILLGVCILLLAMAVVASGTTRQRASEYVEAVQTPVPLYLGPGIETDVIGDIAAGYEYRVVAKTLNWIKIDHPSFGRVWLERKLVSLRADPVTLATAFEDGRKPLQSEPVNVASTAGETLPGVVPVMVAVLLIGLFVLAWWVGRREEPHDILHHHS